ncbi:hypothetical protein [Natronosalvus caseinilyticus]|uniref:hypothetical protein n=1 Tax=Natronosalvus caseinilyticus TaxID=2953747 RepID=UPI0028AA8C46|nr:hypothetical protein [Natronosalvus caseinilyticus]
MITRYKIPEDAVPHEENLLILTTSGKCYGHDFTDIVREIRDGIQGDKLLVEEYFHSLSELADRDTLIQNSVWIIHWDECLQNEPYPELKFYLDTRSYPNESEIILCIDDAPEASSIESKYPGVSVAPTKEYLVAYAHGHLNTANPAHPGGLKKVMEWNNDVCDTLEVP